MDTPSRPPRVSPYTMNENFVMARDSASGGSGVAGAVMAVTRSPSWAGAAKKRGATTELASRNKRAGRTLIPICRILVELRMIGMTLSCGVQEKQFIAKTPRREDPHGKIIPSSPRGLCTGARPAFALPKPNHIIQTASGTSTLNELAVIVPVDVAV